MDGCGVAFVKTRYNQKYCPEHRTKPNKERYRYLREAEEKNRLDRWCLHQSCGKKIPAKQRSNLRVKYCSPECRQEAAKDRDREKRRQKAVLRAQEWSGKETPVHIRQGETLRRLEESGDAMRIDAGILSVRQAAVLYETTPATISRSMDAWRYAQAQASKKQEWSRSWLVQAMLPFGKLSRLRVLGQQGNEHLEEFGRLADELAQAYAVFSRFFFRLEGVRPIVKPFHQEWIRSIIVAYAVGGKQLILSPPRHGKSELLIRFPLW